VLPEVTADSRAFWTGGADGELRIYRCRSCQRYFHPPVGVCFRCHSRDVGPEAVSGRATVATYTVNQHPWFGEASLSRTLSRSWNWPRTRRPG